MSNVTKSNDNLPVFARVNQNRVRTQTPLITKLPTPWIDKSSTSLSGCRWMGNRKVGCYHSVRCKLSDGLLFRATILIFNINYYVGSRYIV